MSGLSTGFWMYGWANLIIAWGWIQPSEIGGWLFIAMSFVIFLIQTHREAKAKR